MSAAGMQSKGGEEGGFLGGLSQQARTDLIYLAAFVVVATLLQLLIPNGGWWEAMDTFVNNRGYEIDVVVPFFIMGAIGFGVYSFRRLREVQSVNAARERAQAAASLAQQQMEKREREVQEMERMNRAVYETDLSALVKVDARGKILQANKGMETATGFSPDELVGASVFSYFQSPERVKQAVENAIANGSAEDSGMEIRHMSGDATAVSFVVSSYANADGDRVAVLVCRSRERVAN